MRVLPLLALWLPVLAFGQADRLPRHLIGSSGPLTAPSTLPRRAIADDYVRSVAEQAGFAADDLDSLYVVKEYRTEHNGVSHFVYKQQYRGIEVYGASWTVNLDSNGAVLNAGGFLYPAPGRGVEPPDPTTSLRAVRSAAASVNGKLAERFVPFGAGGAKGEHAVRFHRGAFAEEIDGEMVWFPIQGVLRPAWKFLITDEDGALYEVISDSETPAAFQRTNLTLYQDPKPPRGLVFDRGPQPNPKPGELLTAPPPYVQRSLVSFAGDPVASPTGWVSDTATTGNNTVTGENIAGTNFLATPRTVSSATRDFSFPLEMGPAAPSPMNYTDAVTTNLFYWINRAHDWFYLDGFDEQAGNFQRSNLGRAGVAGDAILAYSHYGAAAAGSPSLNNSSFSTRSQEDGSPSAVRMYLATFPGNFFTDGSLDEQVIVHEYTHGVSFRLARDVYTTFQGAAMGEAWSDFFAAEYTLPTGAPADGAYPTGEYFTQAFGSGIRTRPYTTNFDINPLTFDRMGFISSAPEVHADGEIWMEALWEARGALIQQFGEAEGRKRVQRLVLDGMKLEIPKASMVDARDAILLADRVDYQGASQDQLWTAFAKRGLGVLASTTSGDTAHVLASFEKPSARAAMKFYDNPVVLGETLTLVLQDANSTASTVTALVTSASGDRETLRLRRNGSVYVGSLATSGSSTGITLESGSLALIPGDTITAYYNDPDTGTGFAQITASTETLIDYTLSVAKADYKFSSESPVFTPGAQVVGSRAFVTLPFPFPFYGKTYRNAQIHSGGVISFGLPPSLPCTDRASFAQFTGIAPLFGEYLIGGTLQKDENVYVSRPTTDSVTYRWVAETFSSPTPVNFAVTLYEDGRILMQYGAGNQNIGNVASVFGCTSSGPVVGLSPGHGGYRLTLSVRSLESAGPYLYTPAINAVTAPQIILEGPAEGAHVKDTMTVSGIAFDTGEAITRIDTIIDGVLNGRVTASTVNRTDYCASNAVTGCPRVGFSTTFATANLGLAPGTHNIQLLATNARGAISSAPAVARTFVVDESAAAPPTVVLERPAAGGTLSGSVAYTGYAYSDPTSRITGMDLVVDGLTYGQVAYGAPRPDICANLKDVPACPAIGFAGTLNTVSGTILMPNGDHNLQFRVRDSLGRSLLLPPDGIPVTVANDPLPAPVVVIESPQPNGKVSGTMRVSGYAYVPNGRVTALSIVVDGLVIPASPVLNEARPELCAALPAGTTCPAVGWRIDVDSRRFINGVHGLRITATSDKAVRTSVPSTFGLQNFYVEN